MAVLDPQTQLSYVATVAKQTALMAQAYRSWPAGFWERPTFCAGWKAVDAVAHLATGGDFYAQAIRAGRAGTPQLPWGVADAPGFRTARTAAVQKLLDGGPAALLEGFEQSAAQLQQVLESLQVADLSREAWHPRGLIPLGSWIGMRLTELGIHDWDIRQPHEAQAALSPTVLPALLAVIPEMQMQFLAQRLSDGMDGVYVLRAGETSWGFTVRGKSVTYHAKAPDTYDACLSADPEGLILLTVGRANLEAKLRNATLTVTGNPDQGQQFCATLFRAF
jgi:uncharacterized protein (TIGR03083 family)